MSPHDDLVMENARILWGYHNTETPLGVADFIIGLGSYDLRVAGRCADLFVSGLAPRIIFAGACGNWTRGKYVGSEAQAFCEHAVSHGVPRDAISLEQKSTNIGENIGFVRAMAPDASSLIWVTKPQTRRRVSATLEVKWPDALSMVTAPVHSFAAQPSRDHPLAALIAEMVGDVWRMAAYAKSGFQGPQPIPPTVSEAFDMLVAAGFTNHLPTDIRSLLDR